jgi:hypothetical protein
MLYDYIVDVNQQVIQMEGRDNTICEFNLFVLW